MFSARYNNRLEFDKYLKMVKLYYNACYSKRIIQVKYKDCASYKRGYLTDLLKANHAHKLTRPLKKLSFIEILAMGLLCTLNSTLKKPSQLLNP